MKWEKGDFIARSALMKQKEEGIDRKLVGFEVIDRGIARHGHEAYIQELKWDRYQRYICSLFKESDRVNLFTGTKFRY